MTRDKLASLLQDGLSDLYDDELLNSSYGQLEAGKIDVALRDLLRGLDERRSDSSDVEWKGFVQFCMLHPIRQLVHQDPFSLRAFAKPRGYAGDAELLDFIYEVDEGKGPPDDTSPLGRQIFQTTINSDLCKGVRSGARRVAEIVDRLAQEVDRPEVLALAAGHLREAYLCAALKQDRIDRWLALDSDTDTLTEVRRRYSARGVKTAAGTVRQIIAGKLSLGEFHFVYSTNLFNYLPQSLGKRLVAELFDRLRPGGQLLIGNFLTGMRGRGYLESFLDWHLIYRSLPDMLDLAMAIDQTRIREIRLQAEDLQNIVFLHVSKE
jgi:hypothetical protein